jgi:hypothetical protein
LKKIAFMALQKAFLPLFRLEISQKTVFLQFGTGRICFDKQQTLLYHYDFQKVKQHYRMAGRLDCHRRVFPHA